MGQVSSRKDFDWVEIEEPHKTRRKLILEAHPEIKELMGHDPSLKYKVTIMVLVQLISAYYLRDSHWSLILVTAYCWGGVINHSMALAIHEISHNMAFGHFYPFANRLFGIFGNSVMGIPYSTMFKKYHLEHHRYQGDEYLDVDIPTKFEAIFFNRTLTKLIWVILQPYFYAIRPLFIRPKPITSLEIINFTFQFAFDVIIYHFFGFKSMMYLIVGTLLAMGMHPLAGHFISEHYVFKDGFETYSYYGPLNLLTFNVGYHNEHHDFPNIPGCKLPLVKKIAPEFYDNLPCHNSWVKVIYEFITNPNIGPYARIKRRNNNNVLGNDKDE
ncbi:hypothetical protein HELRODRAFT_66489 [Helobdella robusta]|uniref:sphingolipid 4-desaturase n=1 Tax=Helobdella robusta TaxID=6412 RepID=T1FYM1_HELRO|nr:hypothetical protein HELRODRAFT_66489 [Helobdella robusta]ESN98942.1 hypothetical protein HELRODRAFT_66489 [Helobdella robusta]